MGLASRKLSDWDLYRESYMIGVGMLVSGALLSSIRESLLYVQKRRDVPSLMCAKSQTTDYSICHYPDLSHRGPLA